MTDLSGRYASGPRVALESLETGYDSAVPEALKTVGFFSDVPRGSRVFLKPNLTYPEYRPGVMTSIECLESVARCLVTAGYEVIIGEADSGGYNRFAMDYVFQNTGIFAMAERVGAQVVNLSFLDTEQLPVRTGRTTRNVAVPRMLLREIDAFITLPVPKIHMNTLVSLSIKNQWGCIQDPAERLKLHPYFSQVMYEFNRRLPRSYTLMDGRVGLNRTGPMKGDVVDLGWLLASDDLVAADRVACRLMQVDENRVAHLRYFQKQGWWTPFASIQLNRSIDPFLRTKFYLERSWTDLPGLFCFNSPLLAWLGYRSPLSRLLHWALYLFREPLFDHEAERRKVAARSATFECCDPPVLRNCGRVHPKANCVNDPTNGRADDSADAFAGSAV